VVAGCLAVGGGATYCAQNGVDPLGAATGLIAGTQEEPAEEHEKEPTTPKVSAEVQATEPVEPWTETPDYEPAVEEPQAESSSTSSEPTEAHQAAPEPEPAPEEVTPPPEQSFEAASPDYPATETTTSSGSTTLSAGAEQPTPAPANQAPQFGGP
jgi:hypothetical protein